MVLVSLVLLNFSLVSELFEEYFLNGENGILNDVSSDKIDWHDWDLIEQDKLRDAVGEHGEPVTSWIYPRYSKIINDTHGYNGHLSDSIALNRALKDLRPSEYV